MIFLAFSVLFISVSCGPSPDHPEEWSCSDTQALFSQKVDDCIEEVQKVFPLEKGEVYQLWDKFKLCKDQEDPSKDIKEKDLNDMKVCVAWMIESGCKDIIPAITHDQNPYTSVYPVECDSFIEMIKKKFTN